MRKSRAAPLNSNVGPAIFLAQLLGPRASNDSLPELAQWVSSLGYKGVQIPTFRPDLFDLKRAAESRTYCDEVKGMLASHGLRITELSTHRQGHLVAGNPAYDTLLRGFGPPEFADNPKDRQEWARCRNSCLRA